MLLNGPTGSIEPMRGTEKIFQVIIWYDVLNAKLDDVEV